MFYVREFAKSEKFTIFMSSKVMQQNTQGVVVHYYDFVEKFSAACSSERILKIGEHLAQLKATV